MQYAVLFQVFLAAVSFNICNGIRSRKNRHIVYWNSFMTPDLTTGEYTREVEIGEFMDILCPHKGLVGITTGSKLLEFDIYNVTQDLYEKCHTGGRRNLMFACNRPDRENKLTIKFQVVSPSPLGFKFQYCQEYYLVASPRHRGHQSGCHKESTRMKISVGCQDTTTTAVVTTTTTTSESTTTTTSSLKLDDILKKLTTTEKSTTTGKDAQEVEEVEKYYVGIQQASTDDRGNHSNSIHQQITNLLAVASTLAIFTFYFAS